MNAQFGGMVPMRDGTVSNTPRKIVVVGHGHAAHALVTGLLSGPGDLAVVVYAAEEGPAYNRSRLPGVLAGRPGGAAGATLSELEDPRLRIRRGVRVAAVDRMHRLVHGSDMW